MKTSSDGRSDIGGMHAKSHRLRNAYDGLWSVAVTQARG
jgi:hypothetical protein